MQLLHAALHLRETEAHLLRKFRLLRFIMRHKLMQRWIEQANRHRQAIHRSKDSDEVSALDRKQLRKRLLARGDVFAQDHFANRLNAFAAEEHVLGAAKTDADGAKLARAACVFW